MRAFSVYCDQTGRCRAWFYRTFSLTIKLFIMPINTLIRRIAICATLSCMSFASFAASSSTTADTLASISRQMYAEHNENFILAEALKDDYLRSGEQYSFVYENNHITINGQRLPQAAESKYLKLLTDFYGNGTAVAAPTSWRMEGDSISLTGDVLNPSSNFRTRGPWHHTNRKPSKELILQELAHDGIVRAKMPVHLEYTKKALLVNGQSLQPAVDEKYKMLIRLLDDFVPTKESDIYSINR